MNDTRQNEDQETKADAASPAAREASDAKYASLTQEAREAVPAAEAPDSKYADLSGDARDRPAPAMGETPGEKYAELTKGEGKQEVWFDARSMGFSTERPDHSKSPEQRVQDGELREEFGSERKALRDYVNTAEAKDRYEKLRDASTADDLPDAVNSTLNAADESKPYDAEAVRYAEGKLGKADYADVYKDGVRAPDGGPAPGREDKERHEK